MAAPAIPNPLFPIPAFNFTVSLWGGDFNFQEVTGLKAEMGFKEVRSGGNNNLQFKIPTFASYGDVTFKKGVIAKGNSERSSEDVFKHLKKAMHINDVSHSLKNAELGDITVTLKSEKGTSVALWTIVNPALLSWEISTLNAQNNEIAFETLVFSCSEIKHSLY